MDPNFRSLLEAVNEVYLKEGVKGADNTMRKMAAQDRAAGKDKLLSKKEGDKNAAHMGRKIKMSPGYKMEGLDPVGKEDGDVNNDGKKDSSDSYLMKRRKAIAKSMGKDDKMKKEDVEVIEKLIDSDDLSEGHVDRWEALNESGNFTEEEIDTIIEQDIADILARLEKKRISKGGNPDDSPLGKKVGRAMKSKQDEVRKKAGM